MAGSSSDAPPKDALPKLALKEVMPAEFAIEGPIRQEALLRMDAYSAAMAFVRDQISVQGDLFAAIRFFLGQNHPGWRAWWFRAAAWLGRSALRARFAGRAAAARDIRFHYDRSNEFYRQFLDSRMQYSEGHFTGPDCTLEDAQREKLERICRHLDLAPGQRFLDIGCGWGGLLLYAAANFGVQAVGCTLSGQQAQLASEIVQREGLQDRVLIRQMDYRDLTGPFDRIASVGMFEHVGARRMPGYFRKVHSLLAADGLFLNRGIVRPQTASDRPETLFVQHNVFPGGELIHLSGMVRAAERAGFAVISVEDLRRHYARTCRAWVANLQAHADTCRRLVDDVTYRTWLLYLAASAVNFEDGEIGCVEVILEKLGLACATTL
jgi:cyclopropane-fatty-acyl-phospholipid synthase